VVKASGPAHGPASTLSCARAHQKYVSLHSREPAGGVQRAFVQSDVTQSTGSDGVPEQILNWNVSPVFGQWSVSMPSTYSVGR
jgi:hypothetical protein